jgi:hypothetical protein
MNGPTMSDLATLRAAIADSPIYVPASPAKARAFKARAFKARPLPPGFDAADLAILEWIAAEGRRAGGRLRLV